MIEGEQERAVRAQEGVLLLNNLCITYGLDKQVRTLHFSQEAFITSFSACFSYFS